MVTAMWLNNDFIENCRLTRKLIVETAYFCGQAAHIGGSLSMVELLNVLFGHVLKHDPLNPSWENRDIFILSKGHAVLGYFAILHLFGYFDEENSGLFRKTEAI